MQRGGMSRYDLTDFDWRMIEPLLRNRPRGVPRVDDRRVQNGISGCCARVRRGATFPSVMDRGRPAKTDLCAGEKRACGTG